MLPDLYEIAPFEGVGETRFGMTPDEVTRVAGPADDTRHDPILELRTERRGAAEFEYDDDSGTLSAIYVFKPGRGAAADDQFGDAPYIPAFYDGIEVLDSEGFAELLEREQHREGRARTGILFPDIGVVVAGFGKRLPEGRYVITFPRARSMDFEAWVDV